MLVIEQLQPLEDLLHHHEAVLLAGRIKLGWRGSALRTARRCE